MKTWQPIPNWPFPIPWAEITEWESRDTTGELGKQFQKDVLAYIDWAIEFVKHGARTIEEGHKLYAEMTKWKPEMFPKKEVSA